MRAFFIFLLTATLSYFTLLVLPWWTCMLLSFIVILFLPLKPAGSFLATALGVGICWLLVALIKDFRNEHLLSRKMAELFSLPSYTLLIFLTTITGFLTGGLGGWTAALLRKLFQGTTISESNEEIILNQDDQR